MKALAAAALAMSLGVLPVAASAARPSLRACTARDLRPLGGELQGATGSMLGFVLFRNVSPGACALGGRPAVQLLTRAGKLLPTRERALTTSAIGGKPVRSVAAGRRAALFLQWSNWCGPWPTTVGGFRPLRLRVTLTTGTRLSAPFRSGRPRCDVKAVSTLGVSAFAAPT